MRNLAFLLLASALGGLPVGTSLVPCGRAEVIELPYPYYTNQITTVESWVELQTTQAVFLDPADWDEYYGRILSGVAWIDELCGYYLYEVYNHLTDLQHLVRDFEANAPWPVDVSDEFISAWEDFASSINLSNRVFQANAYRLVQSVTNESHQVLGIVDEIGSNYGEVVTSVTFSQEYGGPIPGGCQCPDYTEYLEYLGVNIQDSRDIIEGWHDEWSQFFDGLTSRFRTAYETGAAASDVLSQLYAVLHDAEGQSYSIAQRLRERIQWGFVYPTNSPAHALWTHPTNTIDGPLYVAQTGTIDVALAPASITDVTNALLAVLLDLERTRKDAEQEAVDQLEEDIDEGQDSLDSADSDSFSPASVPTFEFFSAFGTIADNFQHMAEVFNRNGASGDIGIYSDSLRLLSAQQWTFGENVVEVGEQVVNLGPEESSSRVEGFVSTLFGLLWTALVGLLDLAFIRWLVRLCGAFLGVLSGVLSGDLSGLGNLIPKLSEALTSSNGGS